MYKIFKYECIRLLRNRFFVGILLILLFYGGQVLDNATIFGTAHTAPFSPWSFGEYLTRILPLLWIGALFFLTFFTSSAARRTAVLTEASPVSPRCYALYRCAAALTGIGILAVFSCAEAAVFYYSYFRWHNWENLLAPALVTLAPSLMFALGSGWLLGQIRPWLVYLWMALPLLWTTLPLPEFLSIWNGRFFSRFPLFLETLDPPFMVPGSVLAAQGFFLVSGILCLLAAPWVKLRRS